MIDGTPVRLTPSGYGYGQQAQRVRQKRSRQLLPGSYVFIRIKTSSASSRGRLSMDCGPTYSLW